MKEWPAYVVVAAVVVAVLVNVSVLVRDSGSSDAEIMAAITKLEREVAELRYHVDVVAETLKARGASTGDAASGGSPPGDEGLEGGAAFAAEPPRLEVSTEPVDIVLTIDAAGTCTLRGKAVERDKLEAELKQVLQLNPAMRLVIRADEEVSQEQKVWVADAARKAGIHRIALAVEVIKEASDEGPDEATPDTD